jgi:hypothetical protein
MAEEAIQKPIAIIGSVDPSRNDYDPILKNTKQAEEAARQLGRELANAKQRILVYSSNLSHIESHVVAGYVASKQAQPKSIIVIYPRQRIPQIHGEFPEQKTNPDLFDPRTDPHPSWKVSYYQSLPEVKGILLIGGGRATLIMGLLALAYRIPVVTIYCFGGSAEEIWSMISDKLWIDPEDRKEMGRAYWTESMAVNLVKSFENQGANLIRIEQEKKGAIEKIIKDRKKRSHRAILFGVIAAILTTLGAFANLLFTGNMRLTIYALCFIAIPISAGIAGSMFSTLRRMRRRNGLANPPSVTETIAHGIMAGLISAILFFVSQVTANRDIQSLGQSVIDGSGGLDILLLFSLTIGFVAGLTYEAVFGKWETVDASHSHIIETGKN